MTTPHIRTNARGGAMDQVIRDVSTISRIGHGEAMQITSVENRKFAEQLRSLDPQGWTTPTDCTLWDVRAMAAHVVGAAAAQVSPREFIRQVRAGRPVVAEIGGTHWWDGMNEVQVRERAGLSTDELIEEWEAISERALASRRKLPRPIARLPLLKLPDPVGRKPLSYLFDIGFTRDVWAHRIDIAHASGRALDLDGDHDARIVADIVAEWSGYHGEPFRLELTGPAGGEFRSGTGGEQIQIDAIEFVRILAERVDGDGVLRHKLPL
ncbi:MAG TPA: maleylpyruvate isomerase family mycothiol-dependent enzyme [Nocardioidaceae bacterium]|nr:maleylpyruvate isomerase family mycothiol-dependent enzyme [Nocardioidaceae bacterium]